MYTQWKGKTAGRQHMRHTSSV